VALKDALLGFTIFILIEYVAPELFIKLGLVEKTGGREA